MKKRTGEIRLILIGAAAAIMATGCDSGQSRYSYNNRNDCVEEWGDDNCFDGGGGTYYSHYTSSSLNSRGKPAGIKAASVTRGGFGSFFSSGG